MNKNFLQEWLKLTDKNKKNIFSAIAEKINLPTAAIEKDWWIMRTLELVFETEIGPYTVFKGGTSLSKAWNLIDRFSEDIDLALDRTFLKFPKEMTASQIKKLRKASFNYISIKFIGILQKAFENAGFTDVTLSLNEVKSNDEDPVKIEINYSSVAETVPYLQSKVLLEIGCRSLKEPFTKRQFSSFVGEHFKGRSFADDTLTIPTVKPERTFLEKIFLLHEEFQLPEEKMKIERRSRHLYDIEKMIDTEFSERALQDKDLYKHIVAHRKSITPLRGIDYANHSTARINFIPPDSVIEQWKKDYEQMQKSMIYNYSLPFNDLIERLRKLKNTINKLNY